jgi:acetoin:2,6-dichlorophenolindophenol oxidoreductase subunit beta
MPEIEFRQAIRDAIGEEMSRDDSVVVIGEDVGAAGGVFQVTRGLHEQFGSRRVVDTPISELALAGTAFGAAISGLRPIIEIMFGDFMALAMDSLVNQSAKYWFLSNEQSSVPLVVRSAVGAGGRFGPIHSQIHASWFMSVPGIKIVAPATPADAKGLLVSAIRDHNPVLFLEHKRLYALKGNVESQVVPIGVATTVRAGGDVTIVTAMKSVHDALEAAEILAEDGIHAEVIDLRTLRPFDLTTILDSVSKTKRILVVEEGPRTGGWGGEILASVVEHRVGSLQMAWRLAMPDVPLPYSPPLEDAFLPSAERIAASVIQRLGAESSRALAQT